VICSRGWVQGQGDKKRITGNGGGVEGGDKSNMPANRPALFRIKKVVILGKKPSLRTRV